MERAVVLALGVEELGVHQQVVGRTPAIAHLEVVDAGKVGILVAVECNLVGHQQVGAVPRVVERRLHHVGGADRAAVDKADEVVLIDGIVDRSLIGGVPLVGYVGLVAAHGADQSQVANLVVEAEAWGECPQSGGVGLLAGQTSEEAAAALAVLHLAVAVEVVVGGHALFGLQVTIRHFGTDGEVAKVDVVACREVGGHVSVLKTTDAACVVERAAVDVGNQVEAVDVGGNVAIAGLRHALVERHVVVAHRRVHDERLLVAAGDVEADAVGGRVGHVAVDAQTLARAFRIEEHAFERCLGLKAVKNLIGRVGVGIELLDALALGKRIVAARRYVGQLAGIYQCAHLLLRQLSVGRRRVLVFGKVDTGGRNHIELVGGTLAQLQVGRHAEAQLAADLLAQCHVADGGAVVAHLDASRHHFGAGVGLLGDDVDDTIVGIDAIEGGAGSTHHLDALDVLDADGQPFEAGRAGSVVVHYSAVDHDERVVVLGVEKHLVVRDVVETAHVDVVDAIGLLLHYHARNQAEGLLDGGDAILPELGAGEHRGRQRRAERIFLLLRRRRHVLVHYHLKELVDTLDFEQLDGIHEIFEWKVRQLLDGHREDLLFGQTWILCLHGCHQRHADNHQ